MIYNTKRLLFLFFSALFTFYIQGEDTFKYLFINSTPIRAKVIIDGVDKGLLTPCIVKNIQNNQKIIKIIKEGFREQTFEISKLETKKLDVYLISNFFDLFLPNHYLYKIGDITKKGPLYLSNLETGTYTFNVNNNKIDINKTSKFLPYEISFGTAFGLSLVFTGISIGLSQYYGYRSQSTLDNFSRRHYDLVKRGFDISTYVSVSLSSLLMVVVGALIISDFSIRYKNKKQKLEISNEMPINKAQTLYEASLEFLKAGEISKSINVLQSLISLYPNNNYIPLAYYQLGQNYFILNNHDKALENWEIFINEYPVADYYDYTLNNIAEIYYMKKNYKKAINMLDKIVFTENILDKETIFSFKAKVDMEIYRTENNNDYFKLAESDYLTLIDSFPTSERLNHYYHQLIELYNMIKDSDKLNILKKKAESINDPSIRKLILSNF